MQAYFGKVLAGEITKPGSYSRRTVKILGSLDQNTANHFLRLCSISVKLQHIVVPSLGGDARNNVLEEYGLDFATLNLLNEHGLVISEYNSWLEFTPCVAFPAVSGLGQQAICIPLSYQGKHWILMPMSNDRDWQETQNNWRRTYSIWQRAVQHCAGRTDRQLLESISSVF